MVNAQGKNSATTFDVEDPWTFHSIQLQESHSIQFNSSTQLYSILQLNSIQFFNSTQINSIQLNSILQLNSIQFNSIQFNSIQPPRIRDVQGFLCLAWNLEQAMTPVPVPLAMHITSCEGNFGGFFTEKRQVSLLYLYSL
jgi:hypothetical protein